MKKQKASKCGAYEENIDLWGKPGLLKDHGAPWAAHGSQEMPARGDHPVPEDQFTHG